MKKNNFQRCRENSDKTTDSQKDIVSLSILERIAVGNGELRPQVSAKESDTLGLEGKDCPCAPR
jgi:hypothetical protein